MDEQQNASHSRRSYIYESQNGRNKKKLFALIGGVLIVLIVLVAGVMAFSKEEVPEEEEDFFAIPTQEIEPTDTPTPTQEDKNGDTIEESKITPTAKAEEVNREEYTILIQNGSGTAGVAGTLADKLKDLGYKISGTENADNFDYEETVIQVSPKNKELLELLKDDISDEYTIGETSTDYKGDADAVVIIGAE